MNPLSFELQVVLPSGHGTTLKVLPDWRIRDVKMDAQHQLGKRFLRLMGPDGQPLKLAPESTVASNGLRGGEVLTAVAQPVLVAAAQCAFCAFVAGGPAVTWGDAWAWSGDRLGGDSSAVRERLAQGVRGVQSTSLAFAALLEDRSVVTWGDVNCGGDSRHVEAQLCDVEAIQSNNTAFAALKTDGTVVAWGQATSGGTLSPELLGAEVSVIQSTATAFAALRRADGAILAWGEEVYGGDGRFVAHLRGVQKLAATWGAFAALDACGRVAAWGAPNYGGRVADAAGEGAAKVALAATNAAFAALDATGGVVAWGDAASGGEVPAAVQEQLQDVQHIQANSAAFVAIRKESRHRL
ncbi:unnamed protein product [Durusdinium trenchii]|uniref:Ubiquitin-like domain-containing protein n=1 Tax=Durusdinium trenchii TaxID=1381693 RepID=A0ABP0QBC8_9DINO